MIFDESKIKKTEDPKLVKTDFSLFALTTTQATRFMGENHSFDERMDFIRKHHDFILNQIFKSDNKTAFDFITQIENLDVLTKTIYSLNGNIDLAERNMCNKLVYDFFTYPENRKDMNKFNINKIYYMALAKAVNNQIITKLSLSCPEELACLIAICRHSSRSEDKNIKRVITILMKQDPNMITEQMIVDIFVSLFDHITPLFTGIMKDVRDKKKLSESECEIYGRVDLAILDIINQMPTTEITKILTSYGEEYRLGYIDKVKFPIESINYGDYGRILDVVNHLKEEKLFLP